MTFCSPHAVIAHILNTGLVSGRLASSKRTSWALMRHTRENDQKCRSVSPALSCTAVTIQIVRWLPGKPVSRIVPGGLLIAQCDHRLDAGGAAHLKKNGHQQRY